MKYEIEYEIPPLRAIYRCIVPDKTEEEAKTVFHQEHSRGRIRKMTKKEVK